MLDVAIVIFYLLAVGGWGILQSRRMRSDADLSGAAARYSPLLTLTGLVSSFLGGGFSFGLASRVYLDGVGHILTLWGFSAGTVAVGLAVAPRLRLFRGCGSVGALMGAAYGRAARAAVGMLAALFCCAVLGAQLRALGLLLDGWLGLDWRLGALAGAAAITALCAGGGNRAAMLATPLQCLLLTLGFALMLAFGVGRAGGVAAIVETLPPDRLQPFSSMPPLAAAGGFLLFFCGETLAPPTVQRMLTGRDEKTARAGAVWAGVVSVVLFAVCGAAGLLALAFYPRVNPELALPALLSGTLPQGLRGLAAAGMLAGLTAAGAAFLGAAVSSFATDALPVLPHRGAGGLAAVRAATVLLGFSAAAVSVLSSGVLEALGLAYRLWAPAVAAPLVAAVYRRRAGPLAFWVPAAAGVIGMLAWELGFGCPFHIPSCVFGIMVSGVASFLVPAPHENMQESRSRHGFTERC